METDKPTLKLQLLRRIHSFHINTRDTILMALGLNDTNCEVLLALPAHELAEVLQMLQVQDPSSGTGRGTSSGTQLENLLTAMNALTLRISTLEVDHHRIPKKKANKV